MFRSVSHDESAKNDINILLLGATGMGKSTFINAFANYLIYDSLDAAIAGELQVLIPTWFIYSDPETYEESTIVMGTHDDREQKGEVGDSYTRGCRSFVFNINGRKLRLIDTPGIGDTQGPLQDEKNLENILAYISQYDHLNGICIFLLAGNTKLTVPFRFCFVELFRRLHKEAKDNLMFVFTTSRKEFFGPGEAAPIVRRFLKEIKDRYHSEIPFDRSNTFCLDNDAFRFLALCKHGISIKEEEKQEYSKSWNHSCIEYHRLIERILKCRKHDVLNTISLNLLEQLIRKLSRPVAEITRLIEENLKMINAYMNKNGEQIDLQSYLLPQLDINVIDLDHPRTVGTNEKFLEILPGVDGIAVHNYTQHCHPHCYLEGVDEEVIGDEKLKDCAAINKATGICNMCHFSWKEHMHITYEVKKVIINIDLKGLVNNGSSVNQVLEVRHRALTEEKTVIIRACAKLTQFIRANALTPVNDDIFEYMSLFLKEERKKKATGIDNDSIINGLEQLLEEYQFQKKTLDEASNNDLTTSTISIDDPENSPVLTEIRDLIERLFFLPINGSKIKEQVERLQFSEYRLKREQETTVKLPEQAASSSVMRQLGTLIDQPNLVVQTESTSS